MGVEVVNGCGGGGVIVVYQLFVALEVAGVEVAGAQVPEHPGLEVVQEAVHADAVLQAHQDAGVGGDATLHIHVVYGHEHQRRGQAVGIVLDRADGADDGDIKRIRIVVVPQALAPRVVGVEEEFQTVLGHHDVGHSVRIVRQLGKGHPPPGAEAIGLEVLRVGQELHDHEHLSPGACGVALGTAVTSRIAPRIGPAIAQQGRGESHVGVLAHTAHQVQVGIHQRGGIGGLRVVAGSLRMEHVEGDDAEAVGIIAQGDAFVVRHHHYRVEDDPRENTHQDEFGQQPTVAAAARPEGFQYQLQHRFTSFHTMNKQ